MSSELEVKNAAELRRRHYIDPEAQLPMILGLIFLATFEGILVGWGFHQALIIAQDWKNAQQIMKFFSILILTIVPLVGVNFWLGMRLTHKLIGPISRVRQAMSEIAHGNLDCEVSLREGDFLRSYVQDVNFAIQALKRLIYRDRQYAKESDEILTQCRDRLAKPDIPESARVEIGKLIAQAKSRLSIVNAHFVKRQEDKR